MDKFATTSVRLTREQMKKMSHMAHSLGVSRNRLFGVLIDSAQVEGRPSVIVNLATNSEHQAVDPMRQGGL